MKILMVLNEEFPPDFRVEKEAKSLIENGHEILLLCYTSQKGTTKYEIFKGIKVRRFRINKSLRNKLHALYLVFPFYRWIWMYHINRLIKKEKPDALHVHDLPLTDIGVKMKIKYGVKLICDQHEFYSNWIGQNAHMNTFVGKIVKTLSNWKRYERKNLQKADLIVTVEEPLRQVYIDKIGIPSQRIVPLPNTPPRSFANTPLNNDILKHYKDFFVLFYSGGIDILRGIDTAIKALPLISSQIPEIKLVLAGKVWRNSDPVKMAWELGVGQYVDFVGWISADQMPSYIAASEICFHVPPAHNEEINRTIQTKIYQYIHLGKPVIAGQPKMVKEFVMNNQIGYSIRERDHEDFANKVLKLYKKPDLRNEFGNNALKVAPKYIWENSVKPMLSFYQNYI